MKLTPLFLCFFMLNSLTGTYAQVPDVKGVIRSQDSTALEDVFVQLLNTRYQTYSGETGEFYFSEVPPGNYILSIRKPGFAEINQQILIDNSPLQLQWILEPDSERLGEVIVTAQKREEQIQRIPLSITSLSYKVVGENQIWSTADLSGISPNLYASDPGDGRPVISLRGIVSTSYDPAVTTYIDGVSQFNLDTYIPQLFEVERIEVLRGPQGTLYGRNAMGGVINISTRQPGASASFFGEVTLGNYGQQRYVAGLKTPLIEDKLYFGAAGLYGERMGFYENTFNQTNYDQQHYYSGNYYLKYFADPAWEFMINLKHISLRNQGAFPLNLGLKAAFTEPYVLNQNEVTQMVDNTMNASLSANYRGNNLNFSSQTAYQQNHRFYQDAIDADFSPYDAISIYNNYGENWNYIRVLTQEFRFSSPGGTDRTLNWTAGSYFFYKENPVKQATMFGEDAAMMGSEETNFSLISTSKNKAKGAAFFGQVDLAVSKKLSLVAGLRYDLEEQEQFILGEYQPETAPEPVFEFQADTTAQAEFNAWSPKAGLSYEFDEEHLAFFTYSRGYRSGGLTPISSDPSQPPLHIYHPEFSNNFELGTKNSFFRDRLLLNAVLFYTRVTDVQVPTLVLPDAVIITRNTGALTSKGAELEIRALAFKDLELSYDLGFTDAVYESLEIAQEGEVRDYKGNKQVFTPEVTSRLALLYEKTLGRRKNSRFLLRMEWKYFGRQYFDLSNTLTQSPYHLFDGHIGYAYKDWKITFWARNVLGEEYISYGYNFGAVRLGNPRTFGTSLVFRI